MTIPGSRERSLLKKVPGLWRAQALFQEIGHSRQALRHSRNPFLRSASPGHFYSPIPDVDYVHKHRENLFGRSGTSVPGLALAVAEQAGLIEMMASYYEQMPFPDHKQDGLRYYFDNPYFGHGSAIILYSLMRHAQPKRIVEVGSGFSSAAMLDVNDRFFGGNVQFTFVEPFPERLYSLLTESDRASHIVCEEIAQQVPRSIYADLQANDILFIDSPHVAKIGSDVVFLLTEILPLLNKGVIIQIHDIYWPFEYLEDWVLAGRAWNEAYMVKAFLQFNSAFEILLFNSYLGLHQQALMQQCMPRFLPDAGSSLWLRKTA